MKTEQGGSKFHWEGDQDEKYYSQTGDFRHSRGRCGLERSLRRGRAETGRYPQLRGGF